MYISSRLSVPSKNCVTFTSQKHRQKLAKWDTSKWRYTGSERGAAFDKKFTPYFFIGGECDDEVFEILYSNNALKYYDIEDVITRAKKGLQQEVLTVNPDGTVSNKGSDGTPRKKESLVHGSPSMHGETQQRRRKILIKVLKGLANYHSELDLKSLSVDQRDFLGFQTKKAIVEKNLRQEQWGKAGFVKADAGALMRAGENAANSDEARQKREQEKRRTAELQKRLMQHQATTLDGAQISKMIKKHLVSRKSRLNMNQKKANDGTESESSSSDDPEAQAKRKVIVDTISRGRILLRYEGKKYICFMKAQKGSWQL